MLKKRWKNPECKKLYDIKVHGLKINSLKDDESSNQTVYESIGILNRKRNVLTKRGKTKKITLNAISFSATLNCWNLKNNFSLKFINPNDFYQIDSFSNTKSLLIQLLLRLRGQNVQLVQLNRKKIQKKEGKLGKRKKMGR